MLHLRQPSHDDSQGGRVELWSASSSDHLQYFQIRILFDASALATDCVLDYDHLARKVDTDCECRSATNDSQLTRKECSLNRAPVFWTDTSMMKSHTSRNCICSRQRWCYRSKSYGRNAFLGVDEEYLCGIVITNCLDVEIARIWRKVISPELLKGYGCIEKR